MQNFKNKFLAVTLLIISINTASAAEELVQSNKVLIPKSVIGISDIKSEISYTKALLELEKAKYQLTRAKAGIFDDGQTSQSQSPMPGMFSATPSALSKPSDNTATASTTPEPKTPRLAAVYGGAKLTALFKYSDGSSVEARAGETLPGGYVVKSVTVDRVQLVHEGKVINVGS